MMTPKSPAGEELLIAGVGGWGIVTIGDLLAKAALKKYRHVVWFPSYATVMRGGESECCVIFSDEKIPSPIIYRSGTVVVLGAWRIKAFEDRVRPGGLILAHNINMMRGGRGSGIQNYVKAVTTNPDLETIFYGQGGGISVTLKKR